MKTQRPVIRTHFKSIGLSSLAAFLILGGSLFIPWDVGALTSLPQPAQSYAEAVQRIDKLKTQRASEMNPECITQFMSHGQKVQKVIVLVHGYSGCPMQFNPLGKQFYALGYNVLIAPLPHHGLADRKTTEQGQLTAEELATYADQVVDIAQGLGEQVTIMGASGGGLVAAWAAQNRSDVDTAVVIAPAFGYKVIPTLLTAPMMNIVLMLPDTLVWNGPDKVVPEYDYPGYSKHALAQILRFGFSIQLEVQQQAPQAKHIFVVTNGYDDSVNNQMTNQVAEIWRQHGAQIVQYEFPAALRLPHDLVDPNQPAANPVVVDQKLIALLTQ